MMDDSVFEKPFLADFPPDQIDDAEPIDSLVRDIDALMAIEQFDHRPERIETLALEALQHIRAIRQEYVE